MKRRDSRFSLHLLVCVLLAHEGFGQGYGNRLTIQGIDHNTPQSAASRAAGGATIGIMNDVGLMFMNPAALQTLTGIQISLGGMQRYGDVEQNQQYAPLKYYSNFSLLMEGLTGHIPNPDTLLPGVNPGDTVQRPFDTLGPNWSRSKDQGLPMQVLLAVPFTLGENRFVVGIGAVEYADLDHYYQNNNVLSPSILSERPIPIPRPPSDSLPVQTQWSQFLQSRDGSIRGYGLALSGSVSDEISLGISGTILKGSTDDYEQRVARGRLTFFTNYFRLDSVYSRVINSGTSDFSGQEFTFSAIYRGRYVSVGFAAKLPTTIKRKYAMQVQVDSTGSLSTTTFTGEDEVRLPWRGTAGLAIAPAQDLTLCLEYELRSYASAVFRDETGVKSNPWLSSSVFHVGATYTPTEWLTLRGGIRGQAEVFETEGNPIAGEPVSYSVYSLGAGVTYAGIRLNVAYEYSLMKYQDIWGSAISLNRDRRHAIVADVAYELPWMR